ncbi:hypothetical protein [Microbacterium sp. 5K110]|uniref:hypothetical protein n=1 Tax=unclassified Microbacterium TaxID=2609290 RepID=UPI0010FD009C|nr:hypothetical protein [Microbacterium sp. 5K110]TLF33929.1 hypothetical protein FE256_02090 [Microbacterium sp. 5K110]
MTQTETRPMPGTRLGGFSSGVILVVGVLVVPFALGIAFTRSSSPDAHDYVRMAFAQVAGATIAMATPVALVVQRIIRRSPLVDTLWFVAIAGAVIWFQLANLSLAADTLVRVLPTVS